MTATVSPVSEYREAAEANHFFHRYFSFLMFSPAARCVYQLSIGCDFSLCPAGRSDSVSRASLCPAAANHPRRVILILPLLGAALALAILRAAFTLLSAVALLSAFGVAIRI
jgi:hypothetical protein